MNARKEEGVSREDEVKVKKKEDGKQVKKKIKALKGRGYKKEGSVVISASFQSRWMTLN